MSSNIFHKGKEDIVFKIIFLDDNDKSMLEEFLSRILGKKVTNIIYLRNELAKEYYDEKEQTLDFLANVDGEIVELELNGSNKPYYPRRNLSYFTNSFNKHIKRGKEYDLKTKFILICLSYELSDKLDIREVYTLNNRKENEKYHEYVDNFEVIEYNMTKLMKSYEQKDEKLIKEYGYLMMVDLDKENLKEMKKDGFMEKYEEKLNKVNEDPMYAPLFTASEAYEIEMNTIKHLGIEEGINYRNIEIAKKMLKEHENIEKIQKYTGLTIDEIKRLDLSFRILHFFS